MPLINCEINLDLNWSRNCVILVKNVNQDTTFLIIDTKHYVPVVTLSTQDNAKLFEQSESGLKKTINWNKYQSKISGERVNLYLDYLIGQSFQGGKRLFVLPFEDEEQITSYKRYYLLNVGIKNYNVMIDEQNVFVQPVRHKLVTFDSIQKIATG